jgi:hypothetical protein
VSWRYGRLQVRGVVVVIATGERATASHASVRFTSVRQ